MHSKRKGNIGEAAVALELSKAEFSVFKELGDISRIDLIAEKEGRLYRIQVKSAVPKNGSISIELRKCGPNYVFRYSKELVDIFAIYDLHNDKVAFVSSEEIFNNNYSSAFTLRIDPVKNNQTKNIKYFSDYMDINKLMGRVGLEPTTRELKVRCSAEN